MFMVGRVQVQPFHFAARATADRFEGGGNDARAIQHDQVARLKDAKRGQITHMMVSDRARGAVDHHEPGGVARLGRTGGDVFGRQFVIKDIGTHGRARAEMVAPASLPGQ